MDKRFISKTRDVHCMRGRERRGQGHKESHSHYPGSLLLITLLLSAMLLQAPAAGEDVAITVESPVWQEGLTWRWDFNYLDSNTRFTVEERVLATGVSSNNISCYEVELDIPYLSVKGKLWLSETNFSLVSSSFKENSDLPELSVSHRLAGLKFPFNVSSEKGEGNWTDAGVRENAAGKFQTFAFNDTRNRTLLFAPLNRHLLGINDDHLEISLLGENEEHGEKDFFSGWALPLLLLVLTVVALSFLVVFGNRNKQGKERTRYSGDLAYEEQLTEPHSARTAAQKSENQPQAPSLPAPPIPAKEPAAPLSQTRAAAPSEPEELRCQNCGSVFPTPKLSPGPDGKPGVTCPNCGICGRF